MSVRKRSWVTNGERKGAWVVDYADQHGDRHIKTFARKADAVAYHATVAVSVRAGTHTAENRSVTVAEAGGVRAKAAAAGGGGRHTPHPPPTPLITPTAAPRGNNR